MTQEEPDTPVVLHQAREALADLLASSVSRPSCQAGLVARCICWSCTAARARSAIDALDSLAGQPQGWRPIETAPKDGTEVDLFGWIDYDQMEMRICDCEFKDGAWTNYVGGKDSDLALLGFHPTHWMPRPAAPNHPDLPKKEAL